MALGRHLLERNHYASAEVEKKLVKLTTDRADMMHRWEDRWEYLRLSQFPNYLGLIYSFFFQFWRSTNSPGTRPWPKLG
jgi:hypothetical protein